MTAAQKREPHITEAQFEQLVIDTGLQQPIPRSQRVPDHVKAKHNPYDLNHVAKARKR